MNKKTQNNFFWAIVLISSVGLFFSPKEELLIQLKTNIPWVALGILVSELILTTGFLLMLYVATPAFVRSFSKNIKKTFSGILNLKETISEFDWGHVSRKCNESNLFWTGYWLSVLGAVGDGIVLILGIGRSLPIASWGLMVLPFWDLGLTFIIRKAIYNGIKK